MYFFVLHIVILSHVCCCKNMLLCVFMTASRRQRRLVKLQCNRGTDLCKIAVKLCILVNVCVCVRALILSQKPTQPRPTRRVQACPGLALISLNFLESGWVSFHSSALPLKQKHGKLCVVLTSERSAPPVNKKYLLNARSSIYEQNVTACQAYSEMSDCNKAQ